MARNLFVNKIASFNFTTVDKLEVGIDLLGWEVKSLKHGKFSMQGAYVYYNNRELWLKGLKINSWQTGDPQPESLQIRDRRLLIRKNQAARLGLEAKRPGFTIMPMQVYVNDGGWVKLQIALVQGKRKYDKRQAIKEREAKRQLRSDVRNYSAGVI